jgi:3-isopropylmalate dehydratase small subunit
VDIGSLTPLISRPGHPEDVIKVSDLAGKKIDSVFIGSCTNGRFEDMQAAATVLRGRKCAPGVVLKIVPSTGTVWRQCLDEGLLDIFTGAGALVGNPGCAGCAAGQIGQNGPGEVTVSTGNRNFAGKQGRGDVYLASPATAAASAVAGHITYSGDLPEHPSLFHIGTGKAEAAERVRETGAASRPVEVTGRARVIPVDNIDTDMIYHNRYLAVTDINEMGQYAFDNLKDWEDFAKQAKPGDIIVTGQNFGAGSSRQQAVDCFASLGISVIIARSFGAIYERNAINAAFPILTGDGLILDDGEMVRVNLRTGELIRGSGEILKLNPFSTIQWQIYERGGLLISP